MNSAATKATNRLVEQLDSRFFAALAEPSRIEVLKILLLGGAADVGTIASKMPQDRSVLSRHLKTLEEARVVTCTKQGRHRIYELNGREFVTRLETILEQTKKAMVACCPS